MASMNTHAYYAITALDKRYNQSELSGTIEAKKPELIPPTSPLIKRIEVLEGANVITWVSGKEKNLSGYNILRRESEETLPVLFQVNDPMIMTFEDKAIKGGIRYIYTVTSISEAGLKSRPSEKFEVTSYVEKSQQPKKKSEFNVSMEINGVLVKWTTDEVDILSISLYKQEGTNGYILMRDSLTSKGEYLDKDIQSLPINYMLVIKKRNSRPIKLIQEAAR